MDVSIKLKLLNRKMNTTTTTTNNNASPTIFGITMGPLNMVGIFAAGIVGRSILKTFLGGAASPIILLLLAGYELATDVPCSVNASGEGYNSSYSLYKVGGSGETYIYLL